MFLRAVQQLLSHSKAPGRALSHSPGDKLFATLVRPSSVTWQGREIIPVETTARDGIQNLQDDQGLPIIVSTQDKLNMIQEVLQAGFQELEIGSFSRLPTVADTAQIVERLPVTNAVFHTLISNRRGLQDFLEVRKPKQRYSLGLLAAASDIFSQRNMRASLDEAIKRVEAIAQAVTALNRAKQPDEQALVTRAFISCTFGDPWGESTLARAVEVGARLLASCQNIVACDTIGEAFPDQVRLFNRALYARYLERYAPTGQGPTYEAFMERVHYHIHGNNLQVVQAALDTGVRTFDTGFADLGGCPVIDHAKGNLSALQLYRHATAHGYALVLDRTRLKQTSQRVQALLARYKP